MATARPASAHLSAIKTVPIPIVTERPPLSASFSAFSVHNFRVFASSQLVANTALWMQRIAQDWLVKDLTGSAAAVGFTVFIQFLPMLVLGLYGGVIADRYSKRTLLMITQGTAALLAAVLSVLALSGGVQVWHVYLVALLLGLVTVVDNPTRQAFVTELVGTRHLKNAISMNSSIFQIGGLIGPALSGVLMGTVGAGWAFALNAIACLGVVGALTLMRTGELNRIEPAPRARGQLREGLRYVLSKPAIFWSVIMAGFIAVFAMGMPVLLVAFADDIFNTGAKGYGLFNSLVALGALAGALISTRIFRVRLRAVVLTALGFGLAEIIASTLTAHNAFASALIAIGLLNLVFLTSANSLVQMSSNASIRGRVMSVYILVLLGGQAIGGLVIGNLSEWLGPQGAMTIAGAVPLLAALTIAIILSRSGQLRLRFSRHPRDRFIAIVPSSAAGAADERTTVS
ncbi:MFS transporter [Saxibacter everestensis]|uniref:MFS transporter n=1 Tax=Saxibacter everestensis TaxID=2909229 RepID=A0ABY8QRE4_9MICO|nr:MFS transporter [Brevibacteriaceae bacterium ZFBP1038]